MKDFFVLIILCITLFFTLNSTHVMLKTRTGVSAGYFQTAESNVLPPVLIGYLRKLNIRYSIYIIPNYVKDFLTYDKNFKVVYKSKFKYSVLLFYPQNYVKKDSTQYSTFYKKVKSLVRKYPSSFNFIVVDENMNDDYILTVDKVAYNDLKEYCGYFCLINPKDDTLFTLKKISATELEALDAIFQQYYMLHR